MSQALHHALRMAAWPVNLPATGAPVKSGARLEDIIRSVVEGLCTRDPLQLLIASNAAMQRPNVPRGYRGFSDYPSQLFHGLIDIGAEHPFTATPPPTSRDDQEPLPAVTLQLLQAHYPYATGVKPQNTQPFCHFSQHAINYKTPLQTSLASFRSRAHLSLPRSITRAPAGTGRVKLDSGGSGACRISSTPISIRHSEDRNSILSGAFAKSSPTAGS